MNARFTGDITQTTIWRLENLHATATPVLYLFRRVICRSVPKYMNDSWNASQFAAQIQFSSDRSMRCCMIWTQYFTDLTFSTFNHFKLDICRFTLFFNCQSPLLYRVFDVSRMPMYFCLDDFVRALEINVKQSLIIYITAMHLLKWMGKKLARNRRRFSIGMWQFDMPNYTYHRWRCGWTGVWQKQIKTVSIAIFQ